MEQLEEHTQVTEIENGTGINQPNIQQNSSQGLQGGQSVIQTNQQSVIQSPSTNVHPSIQNSLQAQLQLNQQAVQVQSVAEGADDNSIDEDSKKRRDILSRRPSYRKIFNDLSSSDSPSKIETIQEDSLEASEQNISAISTTAITYQQGSQTVTIPGTIQIVTSGGEAVQGLQAMPISAGSGGGQATVVQYQTQPDGQQYIYTATPGEVQVQVSNTGTMYTIPAGQQQYIRAGQLQSGLVLNSGAMSPNNQQLVAEEATKKREMRLMKNREAAKECRRKKKEYVKCLENRVAVLENQNKTLIEELKALKDLYCHKSDVGYLCRFLICGLPVSNMATAMEDEGTITVRYIRSLEYRNFKAVAFHNVDLNQTTEQFIFFALKDTLKVQHKAHSAKTNDPIIRTDNDESLILKSGLTLKESGVENETELSFFKFKDYIEYKKNPVLKW